MIATVGARIERGAGVAALVGIVVDAAGIIVHGARFTPLDAAPEVVRDRYVELGSRPAIHAVMIAAAMALYLWFAVAIRAVLARGEDDDHLLSRLFFGAATLVFGLELVRALVFATLGLGASRLSADTVDALYLMSQAVGPVSALAVATALLAASAAARPAGLPTWVARGARVVAAAWVASTARVLSPEPLVWSLSVIAFVSYGVFVAALALSLASGRLRVSQRLA